MPIYEYHCDACGTEFDELVLSRAQEVDVKCKSCGSDSIRKLLSGAAVHSGGGSSSPAPSAPRGGGCHGGGCGCH